MTPFNPLIQPTDNGKAVLSGVQKYLLRVILGAAGKTIRHRGRLVEVLETHTSTRKVLPLMESDLSESLTPSLDSSSVHWIRPEREIKDSHSGLEFWIPRRESDRKRFNIERRDNSRRHRTIGVCWGDSRPFGARRQRLRSRFPSPSYLGYLITELAYDSDAALAAFGRPLKFLGRSDRRRTAVFNSKGYQPIGYGDNFYAPEAQTRRTRTGGGFTEKQVHQGLSKMRTDSTMKAALLEVVYKRQSAQVIAAKFGFSRAKLDVYASRLRKHIRRVGQAQPVPMPSHVDIADLHAEKIAA
jgi:hypothetical protein